MQAMVVPKDVRGVLFLCVANSARSQLAEGLARARLPASVKVLSAGSSPGSVHPLALAALAEVGIDASAQRSKSVQTIAAQEVDLVVTLCQEEVCPLWVGPGRRLHWPMPDPASEGTPGAQMRRFREVRDAIRAKVEALAQALDKA